MATEVWGLLFGQVLSLVNASTGALNQGINNIEGRTFPVLQNGLFYMFFLWILPYEAVKDKGALVKDIKAKLVDYFFCGLFDSLGNYFAVMAYSYISINTFAIYSCLNYVVVSFLSWHLFHYVFRKRHYAGITISFLGVVLYSTYKTSINADSASFIEGSLYSIGSSISYGISNTLQERALLKHKRYMEYLGFNSSYALLLYVIVYVITETNPEGLVVPRTRGGWTLSVLYAVSMTFLYTGIPYYIQRYGAHRFSSSMLTVNFFMALLGVMFFGIDIKMVYVLAFVLVTAGLVIYNSAPVTLREEESGSNSMETLL